MFSKVAAPFSGCQITPHYIIASDPFNEAQDKLRKRGNLVFILGI